MAGVEDNLAPVVDELTVEVPLRVDGAIPPVLEGLFVRNGPNPTGDAGPFWTGDGMVHAVALRDGQAVSYHNRWVRTRAMAARTGGTPPRGPAAPPGDPANVNVVWHDGRLLAVSAAGLPHALTTALDQIAVDDLGGLLTSPVAGHPHPDPGTGSLVWITSGTGDPPAVRVFEVDRGGGFAAGAEIALSQSTPQRDFGLTATRLVVVDLPAGVDPAGGETARIGVLERGRPGDEVRWSDLDPCVVSHVANAYDDGDGDHVVLDVCRSVDDMTSGDGATANGDEGDGSGDGDRRGAPDDRVGAGPVDAGPAVLERWRVGPDGVTTSQVDDRRVGLPRVDGLLAGRPHRYVYCVQGGAYGALARYDMRRDEAAVWDPGPARAAGEPVFVRDPDGHADDEGWILSFVYDAAQGTSDLVIIDGSSWGGPPDAVVHLPARVPFGLHGNWVPASLYR